MSIHKDLNLALRNLQSMKNSNISHPQLLRRDSLACNSTELRKMQMQISLASGLEQGTLGTNNPPIGNSSFLREVAYNGLVALV